MMKTRVRTIRMLLACVAFAFAGLVPTQSSACYGEPCDGICATIDTLNKVTPGEKFDFTRCQLR